MADEKETTMPSNFIHDYIDEDLKDGVYTHVQTRFPPEPNGYLHIGHAKAICINFGTAQKYGGTCNLRLDDTNPQKEDVEYVESIKEDIRWLGFEWDKCLHASDYFDFIYECAVKLIEMGKAYVDDLSADEIREYRGTLTEPGKNSPYRDRSVEENLDLFRRMTAGEFENGAKVLRAKIDMASPNLNMRDPVIYRIAHVPHHRTGDKWCVYPMYDFAHPLSDAKEGVTHSLCSLEFENHRPLYDWFLRELEIPSPPRRIEFARLNLNYCLTSKRKCLALVREGIVDGWDDPRMATLSGMRRRGYPPAAIRTFCEKIGVSKAYSVVDSNDYTSVLSLSNNDVTYAVSQEVLPEGTPSLAIGYQEDGYSSITLVGSGSGAIVVFGGQLGNFQRYDMAQVIASGIGPSSEIVEYVHGTVSGSASGEIEVGDVGVTVYVYLGGYYPVFGKGFQF